MRELQMTLKVEFMAGSEIRDVCCDLCELSNRVGCMVEAKFNDVTVWARPNNNPLTIVKSYEECCKSASTLKIAKGW